MDTTTTQLALTVSTGAPREPRADVDAWCDVPDAFAPIRGRLTARGGETASFRLELDVDHEILWSGATVTRTTLHTSTAVARFDAPGEHVVRAEVYGLDGRLIATLSAFVDVTPGPTQNRHDHPCVRSVEHTASS